MTVDTNTKNNIKAVEGGEDSRGWRSHNGRDYFRPLGESEYAYYVPAAASGLGDMFLHASFTTKYKSSIMDRARIALCWAVTRSRHPLLMSKVILDRNLSNSTTSEEEPYFWFSPPKDPVKEAADCLVLDTKSKEELITNYLNGPRTLSDERMSYLIISTPSPSKTNADNDDDERDYDLLMCAPHFIGDGAALHQCTHDFITLLASPRSSHDLMQSLIQPPNWVDLLPPAVESRLIIPSNGIAKAAAKVNYLQTIHNEIGGHVLRRKQRAPQKTLMVEKSFTEEQTAKILAKCKQNGVTVNHALFALCNIAWGQSNLDFKAIKEPLMMYTALNLRPYLTPHPSTTYWFVALTYFNVVLPSFVPTTVAAFWNRVRSVKEQTRKVVKSPFLTARAMRGAKTRAERVRGSSKVTGTGTGAGTGATGTTSSDTVPLPASINAVQSGSDSGAEGGGSGSGGDGVKLPPAPSAALFGLSLIGNLDTIYRQEAYASEFIPPAAAAKLSAQTSPSLSSSSSSLPSPPPSSSSSASSALQPEPEPEPENAENTQQTGKTQIVTIHTVTTASRQKAGGFLLLEHTFGRKLWLHLCWDVNGFEEGHVESFWQCLEDAVEELVIGEV